MDVLRHQSSSPTWRHQPHLYRASENSDGSIHGNINGTSINKSDSPTGKSGYSTQTSLPALAFLDMDKVNREAAAVAAVSSTTSIKLMAPALISPSAACSGPPPPYSFASAPATSTGQTWSGYVSPTVSQPNRSPTDDKDSTTNASTMSTNVTTTTTTTAITNTARQSVPSIREALGRHPDLLYASSAPPPHHHHHYSTAPSLQALLSGPPNPFAASHVQPLLPPSYAGTEAHDHARPSLPLPSTYRAPHFSDDRLVRPLDSSPHMATPSSPPIAAHPSPHISSSSAVRHPYTHGSGSPIIVSSSNLPTPQSSTPYTNYHHRPAHSYMSLGNGITATATPVSGSGIGGVYGPTTPSKATAPHAWRGDGAEVHRAEEMRRAAAKRSPAIGGGQHYGESVKRHLEIFDLETSLNEIAEGGERAASFARHFCALSHRTQRSGPQPGSFPTLVECDDMLHRQQQLVDSLVRLRDVIVTQQTALAEQQSRDESSRAQLHHAAYATESGTGTGACVAADDSSAYGDKADGTGGFAGADAKKRRGRNAAPGRCHSCNRAETPEWRRGPDGARTLCNACGLHYAKLTRKMGSKAASINSSNLRPKDSVIRSP